MFLENSKEHVINLNGKNLLHLLCEQIFLTVLNLQLFLYEL